MILKYLKSGIRSFIRDKFYASLNIAGLAIGMASCIACFLHVDYEMSYDQFHHRKDRIYRLVKGEIDLNDYWVMMAAPIPPVLKEQFPEVEDFTRIGRISWDPTALVKYQDKSFNEDQFLLVDPSFFQIFDFELLAGDKHSVFSSINSVVITSSNAAKYFGDVDPLGRIVNVDGKYDFEITGIIQDAPNNSHFDFDFLIPFENLKEVYGERAPFSWGANNYYAYLLIKEDTDIENFGRKIKDINLEVAEGRTVSIQSLALQPLADIHFQNNRGNQKPSYNISYIYIFWAIALAVLIIASINFINLTVARSEKRIREVGIRKTMGANRRQLLVQFISESMMASISAMIMGMILLHGLMPYFNRLMENNIKIEYSDPVFFLVMVGITFITGIVSGSYLAVYISSFKPYDVLKGSLNTGRKDIDLKKILFVFQFTISTLLIISSIIIIRQLNYIQSKNLGLDKENVINISVYGKALNEKIEVFKEEIRKSSMIRSVASSSFVPGYPNYHQTVLWEGQAEPASMYVIPVDKDFVETMRIELVEGSLEELANIPLGGSEYILNESALKAMGWKTAYGKLFSCLGEDSKKPVIGVVRDFNFRSLHFDIEPLVLAVGDPFSHDQISVRVDPGNLQQTLRSLEREFKKVMPEIPFEYHYMDDSFINLYSAETRTGNIITFLAIISIVISVFGVYGLASFAIRKRTKEIAIRKVQGISEGKLISILTREFIILILIANFLAWPAAWWIMKNWLMNFTFKVNLGLEIFAFSALLTIATAFLAIFYRAFSASRLNPAEALKYE